MKTVRHLKGILHCTDWWFSSDSGCLYYQVAEVEQVSSLSLKRCVSAKELRTWKLFYCFCYFTTTFLLLLLKFSVFSTFRYFSASFLRLFSYFSGGGASLWRVCYQQGLPRLVFQCLLLRFRALVHFWRKLVICQQQYLRGESIGSDKSTDLYLIPIKS